MQQAKLSRCQVQVYENITKSIAPGVHGHQDVKRAIALMLFGGVHKQTSEVEFSSHLQLDVTPSIQAQSSASSGQACMTSAGPPDRCSRWHQGILISTTDTSISIPLMALHHNFG